MSDLVAVYTTALVDGDGPRACSLMTRAAQELCYACTEAGGSCLTAVSSEATALSDGATTALQHTTVDQVSGENTATASATLSFTDGDPATSATATGGTTLTLSRIDQRWTIDAA